MCIHENKPVRTPVDERGFTTRAVIVLLALACVAFLAGRYSMSPAPGEHVHDPGTGVEEASEWTCSMHPAVRRPGPGLCPICAMDLVPVSSMKTGSSDTDDRTLIVTPAAAALMQVETVPVERRFVTADIGMVGVVDYDETKKGYITAWVPGRLDRLYVDYTGVRVQEGEHMVYLYSPELLTAQEELRRAAEGVKRAQSSGSQPLMEATTATLKAARNKLSRWGLTEAQIDTAEREGTPSDHITIYAPMGGTVIEKNAQEGMYVDVGTTIYTLADLSEVWVMLDAYESDLPWIHYGQRVSFTSNALPGEVIEGQIAFIDPVVNEMTRTARVRVNVPNADGKLKPGMFVRAKVKAQIATEGRVMDPALAGKWISPMHPEIVKDGPGVCDICGMALVQAEDLGYVPAEPSAAPLVIPATAPLITGKRAVVYVQDPNADSPTFSGREISLGPRAGESYIVESGLEEGEWVVAHGNFKIDSALQIQAKTSMMSAPDVMTEHVELSDDAASAWMGILDSYLAIHEALSNEDLSSAQANWDTFIADLSAHGPVIGAASPSVWQESGMSALTINPPARGDDAVTLREAFGSASRAMVTAARHFGAMPEAGVTIMHCPMAIGPEGADWLQQGETVLNPFMPDTMLHCGNLVEPLPGMGGGAHHHD